MTLLLSWICGGCCYQCGAGARGAAGCACTDPLICVVWGVHLRPSFTSIPSASKVQGMNLKHHTSSKLTSNPERCQPWQKHSARSFGNLDIQNNLSPWCVNISHWSTHVNSSSLEAGDEKLRKTNGLMKLVHAHHTMRFTAHQPEHA